MNPSRSWRRGVASVESKTSAGITLLDRLSAAEGDEACRPASSPAAVRASVSNELACLLTTRRPQGSGLAAGLSPTVLDYGLPDLTYFCLHQSRTRQQLIMEIRQAVGWFESRLLKPEVELSEAQRTGSPARVRIVAGIAIDCEIHPFDFEMDL